MKRAILLVLSGLLFSMLFTCTASAVQFNVKEKLLDIDSISEDIAWTVIDGSQYQPWESGIRTAYFSMHTSLYSTCEDDNVLFQIRPYDDDINMREQKVVSSDSSSLNGDDHVQYVQMPINSSNKLEYRVTGLSCSEADIELWAHEGKDYHIGDIAACSEGSSIREIHEDGTVECETDDSDEILWTQDGSDIAYTDGSVGIGTSGDSDAQLYVEAVLPASDGIYSTSESGVGIKGSGGSYGVHGVGGSHGVFGEGNSYGVRGEGTYGVYGVGVYGLRGDGDDGGVMGVSNTGTGGYFSSNSGYGLIVGKGNVGIGTHYPVAKLHVEAGEGEGFRLISASGNTHIPYVDGWSYISGKGLIFRTNGNNERMRITSNGNVGIGTSSPTQRLYVVGNIYATGTITPGSSRDLKEDIRSLTKEEAEDALENLQPTKFYYKADKTDEHLGFIAEDVPALLATADRKGVNPMDVVAVLTRVVQEQQNINDEQQKVIDALREQNKVMNEEIKGLQKEMKLRGRMAMVETH
jgi:hypothetical protein